MKAILIIVSVFMLSFWSQAGNVIFNGAFALGTDGYALERELRVDTNSSLRFIPLEIDGAASGVGQKALKIANPYAEVFGLYSKEFKLAPDTRYKFSGRVKTTAAGDRLFVGVYRVNPRWFAHMETFPVATQWGRLAYEFTTDAKGGYYHLHIRPGDLKNPKVATLWLSDLKLEKIDDGTPLPVEASVSSDQKLYELESGVPIKIALKINNPQKSQFADKVEVRGKDEYTGQELFKYEVPVNLAAGETRTWSWTRKPERYGGVRLFVEASGIRSHDGFYAVIGKYEAKPIDINHDYVVGFNGGTEYTLDPQAVHPSYRVFNAPFGSDIQYLDQMGCRIIREHDGGVRGVDWTAVEPEKGKFDFRHLDRTMDLYEKNNITMFPCIGNAFIANHTPWPPKTWTDWVRPLCQHVEKDAPGCVPEHRGHIYLPPLDLYQNYIARIA